MYIGCKNFDCAFFSKLTTTVQVFVACEQFPVGLYLEILVKISILTFFESFEMLVQCSVGLLHQDFFVVLASLVVLLFSCHQCHG